jgi:hypothetical protein
LSTVVALIGLQPDEVFTRERFIGIIELSIDIAVKEPQRWKLYMSLAFQPEVTPAADGNHDAQGDAVS